MRHIPSESAAHACEVERVRPAAAPERESIGDDGSTQYWTMGSRGERCFANIRVTFAERNSARRVSPRFVSCAVSALELQLARLNLPPPARPAACDELSCVAFRVCCVGASPHTHPAFREGVFCSRAPLLRVRSPVPESATLDSFIHGRQARGRGHTGASRASPLHAPGASLAILNASRRASMNSRQEDLLTPRGWQAAPSEVPAPVANTPLKATCGAMAHQKMSA